MAAYSRATALVVEAIGRGERGELRRVQDLVRVGAADARDRMLVAQQRVQLAATGEHGAQGVGIEVLVERLRTEAGELRREILGDRIHTRTDLRRARSPTSSLPPSARCTLSTSLPTDFSPGSANAMRPAVMRCTSSTGPPSAVSKNSALGAPPGSGERAPVEFLRPRKSRAEHREMAHGAHRRPARG